jgi:endo-1,4-beta-xylanase
VKLSTTPVSAAEGEGLVAALTFDDGPNGADTAALLDLLGEHGIRAVFAVIGSQLATPDGVALLRRMVRDGHVLCNHSTSFDDMGELSVADARVRIAENSRLIREALGDPGAPIPYFRAPNGSWGLTAQAAVAEGLQPLAVVNTIGDWMTQDEAVLAARLRAAMVPGEVVLVHDGGGPRAASVSAVRTVVEERLAAGWRFVLPRGSGVMSG